MHVSFSPQAFQDVVEADIWWRENRDAKDLFSDEVRAVVMLLGSAPRVGQRVKGRSSRHETRRLVLRRSRFLVFYEVEGERAIVLRVWLGACCCRARCDAFALQQIDAGCPATPDSTPD